MYVIFEGIDTSGKSTQIELLKSDYEDALFTKEPGGCELGQEIRRMILHEGNISKTTEMFLFLADRSEHFDKVIRPNQNSLVISDRGFISGIAYALESGDMTLEELIRLNFLALEGFMPDKVVLFWTNKDILKERISQKSQDAIEQRGLDYLLGVQENMLKVIEFLEIEYLKIDASLGIEEINKKIRSYL